jgi:hypothetical protein
VRPRQARWPKGCIASLAEILGSADGNPGVFDSERRGPNFGAQLVHNNLQMRSFYATESTLNHSKQMKRGVREQGRKISKPPPVFGDGAEDHQDNLRLEPTGDSLLRRRCGELR